MLWLVDDVDAELSEAYKWDIYKATERKRVKRVAARRKRVKTLRDKMLRRKPVYYPPSGDDIRALRKGALHMTQTKFAEQLGLKENTIRSWEIGRYVPLRQHALKMAYLAKVNGVEWHKIEEYVPGYNAREPRRPH